MKNNMINNNGSVLILLVVIIAVITTLGITSLNIAMSQYQVKKTNSGVKKAFYLSEGGLNYAYSQSYDLIVEAAADSLRKSDEYILENQEDVQGASNVFYDNYRQCIRSKIKQKIFNNANPYVEVINSTFKFIDGELIVQVSSKYLIESGIEKTTYAIISILIPDYLKTKAGLIDFKQLISYKNFDL